MKPERFVKFKINGEFVELGSAQKRNEQWPSLDVHMNVTKMGAHAILPQTIWCEPQELSETRHSFQATKVYLTTDKEGKKLLQLKPC